MDISWIPPLDADKRAYEYGMLNCPIPAAANLMGISEERFAREFLADYERGQLDMDNQLRRKQLDVAIDSGNVQMLIWLGRNRLAQNDKHLIEHSGASDFRINISGIGDDEHFNDSIDD